jgi:hypothetical protein
MSKSGVGMIMNELSPQTLEAAISSIGEGPVVLVNLLWFRETPRYASEFISGKTTAKDAYFEGYAQVFREIAQELGVTSELLYAGDRVAGLLAAAEDDWDRIVIVRYQRLADLKLIMNTEAYRIKAAPHRLAAIENWRFFATKQFA